jgi:hypothetical protein
MVYFEFVRFSNQERGMEQIFAENIRIADRRNKSNIGRIFIQLANAGLIKSGG